jgi:hypothetical protein
MTVNEAVTGFAEVLKKVTGSYGSPKDVPYVKRVLNKKASQDDFDYVGGIHILNFYAFSQNAYNSSNLWAEVNTIFKSEVSPPKNLSPNMIVLQVAVYLSVKLG